MRMLAPISQPDFRRLLWNAAFCFALLAVMYYLNCMRPVEFVYLSAEDGWAEYGTFVCYILASVLLVRAIAADRNLLKPGYVLMAAGFFFVGMEEISWGQRLFNIKTPDLLYEINTQSELNLHNIIDRIPLIPLFCSIVLVWIFILPLLTSRMPGLKQWSETFGIPRAPVYTIPYFMLSSYIQFFNPFVSYEISELILGFAFVCVTADIFIKALRSSQPRKISPLVVMCSLILVIGGTTGFFVLTGLKSKRWQDRFHRMAAVDYPKHGLYGQAQSLFEYILSKEQLRSHETLFEYGLLLKRINSAKADDILHASLKEQDRRVQEDRNNPALYRRSGVILNLLNRKDEAMAAFQRAVDKDQTRLSNMRSDYQRFYILLSLGKTYFEMGDYKAALYHFKEAEKLASARQDKAGLQKWIKKVNTSTRE